MPRIRAASEVCLAAVAAAVIAYWLTFELRYRWYLPSDQSLFLSAVVVVSAIAMASLWVWYPSRLLVAIVASFGLAVPPLAMGDVFVSWDLKFAPFIVGVVALCVLAMHLRRRTSVGHPHAL